MKRSMRNASFGTTAVLGAGADSLVFNARAAPATALRPEGQFPAPRRKLRPRAQTRKALQRADGALDLRG